MIKIGQLSSEYSQRNCMVFLTDCVRIELIAIDLCYSIDSHIMSAFMCQSCS